MGGSTAKKQLVLYHMLPILKIAAHDYTHFCPYRENRRALRLVLSSGAKKRQKIGATRFKSKLDLIECFGARFYF
jgi:hypothetical protein